MAGQSCSTDDGLIRQVANAYGLPFDVLRAQVQVESGGDPFAFRYEPKYFDRYIKDNPGTPQNEHPDALAQKYGPLAACSYGLLQIMYETAVEIGFDGRPEDLFQDRVGLAWAAKYLRSLLDWAHGDIEQALSAFNGGKGGNSARPFRNADYAAKVLKAAGRTS
jgi:soluble lytic murein transglycosylase-like protein